MANLFNNRENQNVEGFNPFVDNTPKKVVSSTAATIVFWILGLIIFSGIYFLVARNRLLRKQNEINESASVIDVQLAKRADTLIKLYDIVKSHKDFEKETFSQIAKLRSLQSLGAYSEKQRSEIENLNNSVLGRLIAVSENYPELKASQSYLNLMDQTVYLEREIGAARRLYNSKVTEFNTNIFLWPDSVVSSALSLTTYPLFVASQQQKSDVSMKDL
ncbi:LemA family protein [Mycoplasmopsis cynos]|uniref:LemA family n=2 Tax=Mycoplasmopsis cynos TaxID=171284 RepID=L0RUJ3_MYCC1|nr:LemA family protein [Mycoplasmopsis cynos]MCU9933398.1 LemA family protein [Mycoplasmopsis cynos]MCU9934882.1 LemA family protein [Mycoplasmopsis cynos]UWV80901.1 LemA family protein [Mycoplasmopsis cynos]UWV85931.1 LemA family protein [Mycoplasmopsis cynos]WAM05621.1 LemA family protein [Mycoplasmopsis cynos]